jgi:hypothetical protein
MVSVAAPREDCRDPSGFANGLQVTTCVCPSICEGGRSCSCDDTKVQADSVGILQLLFACEEDCSDSSTLP